MSDAIITERSRSPSHKVAHFLTIEGVKSRIAQKEHFLSKPFFCAEEKNQTEFYFGIDFGYEPAGENRKWLSCFLFVKSRDVFVKEVKMTVSDVHLKAQRADTIRDTLIPNGGAYGRAKLLDITTFNLPDDTLCVRSEITFVGAPSSDETDSLSRRDPSFDDDLRRLFSDPSDADMTIVVGEKTFKVHKNLLKARSNYFRTLFESGMAETRTNEVTIEDADPKIFKHFLEYLYTGLAPKSLIEVAWELLPLSDRFDAPMLKNKCERAIISHISAANALKGLQLAHSHCCSDLIDKCLPYIRADLKSLKATKEWKEMRKNADLIALVCESFAE